MNRIIYLIALWLFSTFTTLRSQNLDAQVSAYRADINTYGDAIKKIVSEGKHQEGVDELTALIERCEKKADYSPERLALFYRARGLGKQKMKLYSKALEDYNSALSLLDKAGDAGREEMPITWYQMAMAYYYIGDKNNAMDAAGKSIESSKDFYGTNHSETLSAIDLRSNFAGFYDMKDVAIADRISCFDIVRNNVQRNFPYLTASERSAYWSKYEGSTRLLLTFGHKMNVLQEEMTDAMFNQQLLAKGLLLTAESSLQRSVDANPALATEFKKIRQLRLKADQAKTKVEAEEATLEADRMERSLTTTANELGHFLDFLNINAADVKSKLGNDELAVEFVDYRVGKDSTMYAALVMSPQWQHVRFLPLAETKEISESSDNLSNLIWQPIIEQTKDLHIRNIYFAPSGQLYQIPIESHKLANGQLISDLYSIYRLSSTRWLAFNQDNGSGKDAVVYGGLRYDTNMESLKKNASKYNVNKQVERSDNATRGAARGLPYLAGTKKEAEEITNLINGKNSGLHADLFLGDDGTESSFKSFDGRARQIMHIATHGFYNKAQNDKDGSDALSRCGLFFAGAQNRINGETFPEELDDGVLTAKEIASMDLRGLDLAVLSACETGSGDISGDGVFGLQRGFKKAGANSILMSLWKVDDNATSRLMTEFYSNWIVKHMSKHHALEAAKKTLRETPGWENPKYWAAFILLDAIE